MCLKKWLSNIPYLLATAMLAALVWAVDGDPPGLFELDGDADNGGIVGTVGDDWNELYNSGSNDGGSPIAFTTILSDPAPNTVFWKGGSKDINDVTDWWHRDGSVPDKDDITNAYAAAYLSPDEACRDPADPMTEVDCGVGTEGVDWEYVRQVDDLIVYFGLDRFANSGDAFAGFWFFQNSISANTDTNRFDGGGHVKKSASGPGDLLLLVEYPQGANAEPTIKAYEWDPDDFDGDGNMDSDGQSLGNLDQVFSSEDSDAPAICDGNGLKLACAITNDEVDGLGNDIGEIDVDWPYIPKSGTSGSPPFESFFEGGVNITQLLGETLCISSFLAESRASRSETATLKDFVLGDFNVCSASIRTEIHAGSTTDHDNNVDGGFIDVGTSIHDAAYVEIIGPPGVEPPTGTVTFERFSTGDCSGTAVGAEVVNLSTGVTSGSSDILAGEIRVEATEETPPGAVSLSYLATYSGDSNYNSAVAPCESVTVNKFNSTVTTEIHEGSGSDGTHSTTDIQGGTVKVTTVIHDLAKVTGAGPAPTGIVTFKFFSDDTCTNEIVGNSSTGDLTTGTEAGTITGGRKVASANFDTTGYVTSGSFKWLSYKAAYGGDANYLPAVDSQCEILKVEKYTPTVVTNIHSGNRNASHIFGTTPDIQDTDITIGTIVHDVAAVTGAGPAPTGNVTFKFYTNDQCTTEVPGNASTKDLSTGNTIPNGRSVESDDFDTAGYITTGSTKVLAYKASYGGDSNYVPATDSSCEDLRVVKRLPSIVTNVITLDLAKVMGDGGPVAPTGNVDFMIFAGTGCTGTPVQTVNNVPLLAENGALVARLSSAFATVFTTTGTSSISYKADYDGDANYVGVTHACENVTVTLPAATTGSLN